MNLARFNNRIIVLMLPALVAPAGAQYQLETRLLARSGPPEFDAQGVRVRYGYMRADRQHLLQVGLRIRDDADQPLRDLVLDDLQVRLDNKPVPASWLRLQRAYLGNQPLNLTLVFKAGATMASVQGRAPLHAATQAARELLGQLHHFAPDTLVNVVVARTESVEFLDTVSHIDEQLLQNLTLVEQQPSAQSGEADLCAALTRAVTTLEDIEPVPDRCCVLVLADGHAMDCDSSALHRMQRRGIPVFTVPIGHGQLTPRHLASLRRLSDHTTGGLLDSLPRTPDDWRTAAQAMHTSTAHDWILQINVPRTMMPSDGQEHALSVSLHREGSSDTTHAQFNTALLGWEWAMQRALIYTIPIIMVFATGLLLLALMRRRRMLAVG